MIEGANVLFDDSTHVRVERVKFKANGWIATFDGEDWSYFPPHRIVAVKSTTEDAEEHSDD